MLKFFDEARIHVQAGNGGNGCCSFRREKHVPEGGPDGGNGGDGGSIIIKTNSNLNTLLHLHCQKHFVANCGKKGANRKQAGLKGEDVVIEVPVGTEIISDDFSLKIYDLEKHGDSFQVVTGGKGGIGNHAFKGSMNRSPQKITYGTEGQLGYIRLKMKIIADVGLIGLPNAGKSTLISKLTNAKPKISDYEFTTVAPVIGCIETLHKSIKMVDIPGIIEDAAEGKGMGIRFLKHLERCKMIIHVLDCSTNHIIEDYEIVKNEINAYNPEISKKETVIFVNKIENIEDQTILKNFLDSLPKSIKVIQGSAMQNINLNELKDLLIDRFDFKKI